MAGVRKPSYLNFDKTDYPWKAGIDYRAEPERYRVGKGEQGVLICEPYKGELVPLWRFKTPEIALLLARATSVVLNLQCGTSSPLYGSQISTPCSPFPMR